jgi:hypothetical protein
MRSWVQTPVLPKRKRRRRRRRRAADCIFAHFFFLDRVSLSSPGWPWTQNPPVHTAGRFLSTMKILFFCKCLPGHFSTCEWIMSALILSHQDYRPDHHSWLHCVFCEHLSMFILHPCEEGVHWVSSYLWAFRLLPDICNDSDTCHEWPGVPAFQIAGGWTCSFNLTLHPKPFLKPWFGCWHLRTWCCHLKIWIGAGHGGAYL